MKEELEKLGFGRYETDVYLALLDVGESAVGEIIDRTGLFREQAYEALKRLERKGYVRSSIQQKKRHYRAEDPGIILDKINDLSQIAHAIVPELKKRLKEIPRVIRVLEGKDGYEFILKDIQAKLKDKDEWYVIGAAGQGWRDLTKDYYEKYRQKYIKRGMKLKMVTYQGEGGGIWEDQNVDNSYIQVKTLPFNLSAPSSTEIYANAIAIQIFGDPPLSIMIQNEKVAQSYKNYFDILWQMAT